MVFEDDNLQSYLCIPDNLIHCELSHYSETALTTALPKTTNITFENNVFPNLFLQIRLEVSTQTIESIASPPGVVETLLCFPTNTTNEGWIPYTNSGNYVSKFALKGGDGADEANTTRAEYDAILKRLNFEWHKQFK